LLRRPASPVSSRSIAGARSSSRKGTGWRTAPTWFRTRWTRRDVPEQSRRYGLGFWLDGTTGTAMLVGYDAGESFKATHDPHTGTTCTVLSNTSPGAWTIARAFVS
jgi:hypothetical protein